MSKKNQERLDGYIEAFINKAVKQYRLNDTFYEGKSDDATLSVMYNNALARKIVTAPADDCIKNGFSIEGDEENKILGTLEELNFEDVLIEALYWDRLYGRSCIYIVADDGGSATDELDLKKLRRIVSLEVFDKREVIEDTTSWLINDDPMSRDFGKPEWYQITPVNGASFWVHRSRLILFDGDKLPKRERIKNNGAGLSCLDGVIKAIRRNDTAQARALDIMERMSTSLLKLDGLSTVLQTEQGTEAVTKRLNVIDLARHMLNTVAIDKDDEYQVFNIPVGGIPQIIQEFEQTICALTSIPFVILFGRSPAGMNSTGAADFENYYNLLKRVQNRKVKPALERLVKLLLVSKQGPTDGVETEDWRVKFNELKQLDEKEVADLENVKTTQRKTEVEILTMLMELQLLGSMEARKYLADKEFPVKKTELDLSDEDGTEEEQVPEDQ